MAGIYIHIPYCKQACHYCNFHFSTNLRHKGDLVTALNRELVLRSSEIDTPIETIYLGGGTPSLLSHPELASLFKTISEHYPLQLQEVTLEANPDDIDSKNLSFWKTHTPVNRLSIGVQSFRQTDLGLLNRAHDSKEAINALHLAREAGFSKLNMDLIFGLPNQSLEDWKSNLDQFLELEIPHLSAYSLTIEPKTALAYQVEKGTIQLPEESLVADQFLLAHDALENAGYQHYEISNYAKTDQLAVHNTNYWKGKPYLGIGPGAHSYDGKSRKWNVASNIKYIRALNQNALPQEAEELIQTDRFNEWLMTGLRTIWGINLSKADQFGKQISEDLIRAVKPYLASGQLEQHDDNIRLTRTGFLMADTIIADLFLENKTATP